MTHLFSPSLFLLVPLAAGIGGIAVARRYPKALSLLGIASSITLAALFVWTLVSYGRLRESRELVTALPWIPILGSSVSFVIDGLALLLIGLVVWLVLAAQLVSGATSPRVVILSQLLQVGLFGLLMSRDVLLFVSSWAVVSLVMGLLTGTTIAIVRRRLIFTGIFAAATTMTVVVVCYRLVREQTGFSSTDVMRFSDLVLFPQTEQTLFALLWVGVVGSLALFPFHEWLVASESELSPARRVLVFVALGTMGGGALARFAVNLFSEGARDLATAVVVVALASLLYAAARVARAGMLSTLLIGFQGVVLAFLFTFDHERAIQAFLALMSITVGICGVALWIGFTRGEGNGRREAGYLLFVLCFGLVGLPAVGMIDDLLVPLWRDSALLAIVFAAGIFVLLFRLVMLWRQLGRDSGQRAWSARARWVLVLSSLLGLGLTLASSALEGFLAESTEVFAIGASDDDPE